MTTKADLSENVDMPCFSTNGNVKTFASVDELKLPESKEELREMIRSMDEKQNIAYFRKLFDCLSGYDIPLEAFQLCFGRDSMGLRNATLRTLRIFSSIVDECSDKNMESFNYEKATIVHLFNQCHLGNLVVRIILLDVKKDDVLRPVFNNLHYFSLSMLQCITDEHFITNKHDRVKNFQFLKKYNAFGRLVEFLDPDFGTPLTIYRAVLIMKRIMADHDEAIVLLIKAGCLANCLNLMMRKRSEKVCLNYYNENYGPKALTTNEDEQKILSIFYSSKESILHERARYPMLTTYDNNLECFKFIAHALQTSCALVTYKLLSNDVLFRKETLVFKPFKKTVNKWLSTPCIWRQERSMIHLCYSILRQAIEDVEYLVTPQHLLKHYKIIELVQEHIFNADKDILSSVLHLLGIFLRHYPDFTKKVCANKRIMRALTIHANSFDGQVQHCALQALCAISRHPDTTALVIKDLGITAEHMFYLTKYGNPQICNVFKNMTTFFQDYSPRLWRESKQAFKKVHVDKKYSLERAFRHKEEGNTKFKTEDYEGALKCYTLGLECLPPIENFGNEKKHPKSSCWFVLPSVLYSNRAQCYLSMKKWQETVDDCTQAIVRSYADNDEATKMLYKTVYRRAKAFIELKDYHNALGDVASCLIHNLSAVNVRSLFREVLTEYRKKYGIEPLRRCGACMDGLGTKLKRCTKCPEVYCSRECQTFAWDEGHKTTCNYTLDENDSG